MKHKSKILYTGIILAVVGLGVYLEKTRRLYQYELIPVQAPFQMTEDFVVNASFTAQLNQDYEIEIAVQEDHAKKEEIDSVILVVDKPSSLDIDWMVSHKKDTIAAGKCHDYLYLKK